MQWSVHRARGRGVIRAMIDLPETAACLADSPILLKERLIVIRKIIQEGESAAVCKHPDTPLTIPFELSG